MQDKLDAQGLAAGGETIADILRRRAVLTPDRRAFIFLEGGEREGEALTFGQLDRRARAIAHRLTARGARGERVLLMHSPGVEFIASFFGCLYAGAVAVPLCSSFLSGRRLSGLKFFLDDADAKLIAAGSDALKAFRQALSGAEGFPRVGLLATDEVADGEGDGTPERKARPGALAYIQYTSGSTSAPKGVAVYHRHIIHNLRMFGAAVGITEGMSAVSWLPHFHDMGLVAMIQQGVYAGVDTALMSPLEFIRRPVRWLRAISRYGAYFSCAPNFAYDLCVERVTPEETAGLDLSCWKRAVNGSEPVRPATVERFSARFASCGFQPASFYPGYGLAEATVFVTGRAGFAPPVVRCVEAEDLERGYLRDAPRAGGAGTRQLVSCGRGWGAERIVIVDPQTLTRSQPGRVGEVWVSGPHVAGGYWNRPEESRATFEAYLAGGGEGPFLRTGDLGCIVDGELFITGRLKDLIIIRGKNYYPHDIEATVAASHPALRPLDGAAFSVEVEGREELVIVQEVRGSTLIEQAEEICAAIRRALAEEHALRPYAIKLVKARSIPKTSSGKTRRSACRDEFLKSAFSGKEFCPPTAAKPGGFPKGWPGAAPAPRLEGLVSNARTFEAYE
ncbi:MAG TPA: fatty acyl-AMP ligase [Pyrinomonadaceae bacterium]